MAGSSGGSLEEILRGAFPLVFACLVEVVVEGGVKPASEANM